MNLQLRHSLKWQMIGPIPLMVIAAIAAIWFMVPRKVAESATDQAELAGRSIATQFKTLREYYTENVVDKILSEGTFRASSDHKNDARAIPLPATMILDLSAMLSEAEYGDQPLQQVSISQPSASVARCIPTGGLGLSSEESRGDVLPPRDA